MANPKVLYRDGDYVVSAWLERRYFGDTPFGIAVYVAADCGGRRVWFREATTERAPWWAPWRRRRELATVVAAAIAYIDEQQHRERSAEATLEAVSEAMQLPMTGGSHVGL
jgi:hypothetical protein